MKIRNTIEGFQGLLLPSPAREALPSERGPIGGTTCAPTGREAAGQVCRHPVRDAEETTIGGPIPLLDRATRYALGFAVGEPANSARALDACSAVELTLTHHLDSSTGVIVHQEPDPASTGYVWTRWVPAEWVRLSYPARSPRARRDWNARSRHAECHRFHVGSIGLRLRRRSTGDRGSGSRAPVSPGCARRVDRSVSVLLDGTRGR